MEALLRETFTQKGVDEAAPDFEEEFVFYDSNRLFSKVNCLGWVLGYKGEDFSQRNWKMASRLYGREELPVGLAYLLSHTSMVPIAENDLMNIPKDHYPVAGFMPEAFHGYSSSGERQEDSFVDYHWYRRGRNRLWDHKDGWRSIAKDTDASGKEITNPLTANRYSKRDGHTYSRLFGFFAVPKDGERLFDSPQDSFSAIEKHIRYSLQRQNVPRVA